MDVPFTTVTPPKLYALLLKLRPIQHGTLMAFSGELVHGAWLHWIRRAAPDVASWLHDGNKRRLFTCSSLQFGLPAQKMLDAERTNAHLHLDPARTYTVRITLLLSELFPLLYEVLMNVNSSEGGNNRPPFMQIGKQLFLLEEVVLNGDDTSGWTGFTSLHSLFENARALRLGSPMPLTLEFSTLTTFNRSNNKPGSYGVHFARLPLPQYIFPGLARRWEDVASPDLINVVQRERLMQYIEADGIIIVDYDLKPHHVRFTTHPQQGFIGTCKYLLRGPDEPPTEEAPLTIRQQLILLAQLAFYCGIGYKTSMGMGQARIV